MLLSIGMFTALNIGSKLFTIDSRNQRAFSLVFGVISAIMATLPSIVDAGGKFPTLPTYPIAWIVMLIACVGYAINERYRFSISKNLDASIIPIIYAIAPLIAFLGAVVIYNEEVTFPRVFGMGLIILATILVTFQNHRKGEKKMNWKFIGVAFIAAVFLGCAWMLDKQGIRNFGMETYNIFVWVVPTIIVFLPSIKINDLKYEIKIGSWKIVLLAFLNVVGYYLTLKAMAYTDVTNVVALSQLSTVTTVMVGIIFLKEYEHAWIKICASLIAFVGVYFIL